MILEADKMYLINGKEIKNISTWVPPYPSFWKKVRARGYTKKGMKRSWLIPKIFSLHLSRGKIARITT